MIKSGVNIQKVLYWNCPEQLVKTHKVWKFEYQLRQTFENVEQGPK